MRVDIWSDVVCPWCYLGKRRFELARAELAWGEEIDVRWRAYLLDRRAPTEPQPYREVIERKYGPGSFEAMTGRLGPLGEAVGIDYHFDRIRRVSSVKAHRMAAWADATAGADAADRLHERLFQAYFTEGADIGDAALLAVCAGDAGLDAAAAAAVVSDPDAYLDVVHADVAAAHDREISGVPAFVIDQRWTIPGAQDVETIALVLQRARDRPTQG